MKIKRFGVMRNCDDLVDPGSVLAQIFSQSTHGIFPDYVLPFTAPRTIPLNVWFTFAPGSELLNADKVRGVNGGSLRKSGILRGFKVVEDVENLIAGGSFGR
jgi:hypothetical protein